MNKNQLKNNLLGKSAKKPIEKKTATRKISDLPESLPGKKSEIVTIVVEKGSYPVLIDKEHCQICRFADLGAKEFPCEQCINDTSKPNYDPSSYDEDDVYCNDCIFIESDCKECDACNKYGRDCSVDICFFKPEDE